MKTKLAVWMSLAIIGWSLALAGASQSQTKTAAQVETKPVATKAKEYNVTLAWSNSPGTNAPEDVVSIKILATEGEMSRSRETSINSEDKSLVHEFSLEPRTQNDSSVKLTLDGAFRILEANAYRTHEFSVSPILKLKEPRVIRSINKKTGTLVKDVNVTVTIEEAN